MISVSASQQHVEPELDGEQVFPGRRQSRPTPLVGRRLRKLGSGLRLRNRQGGAHFRGRGDWTSKRVQGLYAISPTDLLDVPDGAAMVMKQGAQAP